MKNILLIYKKSVYEIYFIKRMQRKEGLDEKHVEDFENSHQFHYSTLKFVQDYLEEKGLSYCSADRERDVDYAQYDFVITVGGDGTLLNAAGKVSDQPVLAVNSNPSVSVGRFCPVTAESFKEVFDTALAGNASIVLMNRMRLELNGRDLGMTALNDLLICHKNPAAMSHYSLVVDGSEEHQRSSGVWVATAAGSTGAIQSAGLKPLELQSRKIAYQPRELYWKHGVPYKLNGGSVNGESGLVIKSLMEEGMIYIDGSRGALPFGHGDTLRIFNCSNPLHIIDHNNYLEAHHLKRN